MEKTGRSLTSYEFWIKFDTIGGGPVKAKSRMFKLSNHSLQVGLATNSLEGKAKLNDFF